MKPGLIVVIVLMVVLLGAGAYMALAPAAPVQPQTQPGVSPTTSNFSGSSNSTPPPVAAPVAAPAVAGGFTTVQLCSPWKTADCARAGADLTCAEFHACRKASGQVPCGGDAWYNKCGWGA